MADNNIQITLTANSDQVAQATDKVNAAFQGMQAKAKETMASSATATDGLANSMSALSTVITRLAATYAAIRTADYIKDSALLAARYETLGVTMDVVGRNAGYSHEQMEAFSKGMQAQGITMVESRESLARLAQAHVDLAQSAKLARIAQDAAVIGGINSSEAFKQLVYGIQTANVRVLRTIGINVNFQESYQKLAHQLGITTLQLTEQEKSQARVNAVEEAGVRISGAYLASMETAGKQLSSLARYFEDFKVKLGEAFGPAVKTIVASMTGEIKNLQEQIVKPEAQESLQKWADAVAAFVKSLAHLASYSPQVLKFLDDWGGELVTLTALVWGAQKAQLAFNAAASMNPYLLAATGVVAAGSFFSDIKQKAEGNWQAGKFDKSIPIASTGVDPSTGYMAGTGVGVDFGTIGNEQILELHRQKDEAKAALQAAQEAQAQKDAQGTPKAARTRSSRVAKGPDLDMHAFNMNDLHSYNSLVKSLDDEAARDHKATEQAEAQATKDKVAAQMAYLDGWFKENKAKASEMSAIWKSAYTNMQSFVGNSFSQLLQGNYKNIGSAFGKMLQNMVSQWTAAHFTMMMIGSSNTGQLGGLAGAAISAVSNWFAPGSSAGSYGVMASDGAAPAVASTTPIWSSSIPGVMPSYSVGTDYVPYDMVAKIHKGERIVPAAQNTRGGAPINITVHVASGTPDEVRRSAASGARSALAALAAAQRFA